MSNLVLELKSGETMLINGAAIRFRTRTRIELLSRARFLFGRQIMSSDEAQTPAGRLCHALQMAYVGADDLRAAAVLEANTLLEAQHANAEEEAFVATLAEIRSAIAAGEFYPALRRARGLVAREAAGTMP